MLIYWRQLLVIGALIAIAGGITWHFASDRRTEAALKKAQADLVAVTEELRITQENFVKATEDAKVLESQKASSDAAREKIKQDLQVTLKRLKNTPAPKECDEQVPWLYELAK